MKMIHIMDGPPLFTNCFLLIGEGQNGAPQAVAVDPAAPVEKFARALEENGATLEYIFLTHGHYDHVGSVAELKNKYGAKLCMNEHDAKFFNMENNVDIFFTDGGKITVDGMEFTTYFTPGHTPGSTCILCKDLLFSGDTLFAGGIGRTDFEGSSPAQMRESLIKLKSVIADNVRVLPGHEEFSTMKEEKQHNSYLRGL